MSERPTLSAIRALVIGSACSVVYLLPVYLTGAMAVQLTDELRFDSAGLGMAVAGFWASGAVLSPYLGRVADRLGALRSIRITAAIAALTSLGITLTATRWASLLAWLAFGGIALALGQPAVNRLLSVVIRSERLGTAFGVKQSAYPATTMLAGLSVPAVALTLGWRWTYLIAAVLAVVIVIGVGRNGAPRPARRSARQQAPKLPDRRPVLLLAVAFGLGTSTATIATIFYVDAAVAAGSSQQFAGVMLAVASVAAICTRIALGIVSDRMMSRHLWVVAALLAAGSVGIAMLATDSTRLMAIGLVPSLAGTWGFNGVFWFALVRAFPERPGSITGALAPGGLVGATVGPIVFGMVAQALGYPMAWTLTVVLGLTAAAAMLVGGGLLSGAARPADSVE